MAIEGLRKHTTVLFNSVLFPQVAKVSRVLENHRNLPNHQISITAASTLTGGKYAVYILPDADNINEPAYTGLTLDLTDRDSAYVNFTGVIRGIILLATEAVPEIGVRMSAVVSSFSRYKRSGLQSDAEERVNYVTTDMGVVDSAINSFAARAVNHTNLIYHQIALISDNPITNQYRVRFMPDAEGTVLESTVATDYILDFAGTTSAMVRFGGVISGIHLAAETALDSGSEIRVILSSALERFDELVYEYIGAPPDLGDDFNDHINDFDNPHLTSWDNLVGKPHTFPNNVYLTDEFTIPYNRQLIVWEDYQVDGGNLEILPGAHLIVLHDRPETPPIDPDFTYNGSGELTQIDYAAGEQKLFTYNGSGQLTQVDYLLDGTTYRKSFTYTGGGDLDFITEGYV